MSADAYQAKGPVQSRSLFAVAREWWRPILTALVLCLLVLVLRPSDALDRRLSDRLLVNAAAPADPALLLIEINSEDARLMGGPPIRREELARLLDAIADGGARRVLIDSHLGETIHQDSDARLEAALARFERDRLGLVTSPRPTDLPHPRFARHGTVLDARLSPDVDGWHRQIGSEKGRWGNIASRWLADGTLSADPVPLDIRVSPRSFERYSARAVLAGQANLRDRLIVLGVSADIAPTRAFLPLARSADRAAVLALGAQSVRQGYQARAGQGEIINIALYLFAIVLGVLCGLLPNSGRRFFIQATLAAVLLFGLSLTIGRLLAVPVMPAATLGAFFIMVNVTIVQRLHIVPMMMSFLRGDVSPDEAWAWRTCQGQSHPVLLFSASGRVKRHNAAAEDLIGLAGSNLARLCLPRTGERADQVELHLPGGELRCYQVDWPYGEVPIAVLRDNSEAASIERELRAQLLTDELTGLANRRGFDFALNRAVNSGRGYAVFFMDMNGFKRVNDRHGHHAGDELLAIAGQRFAALIRRGDTLARLGGDEFAIVAAGLTDRQAAIELEQRLRAAFSGPIRLMSEDCQVLVSAAVGHAIASGDADATDVVRQADKEMYRNKLEAKLARRVARR